MHLSSLSSPWAASDPLLVAACFLRGGCGEEPPRDSKNGSPVAAAAEIVAAFADPVEAPAQGQLVLPAGPGREQGRLLSRRSGSFRGW